MRWSKIKSAFWSLSPAVFLTTMILLGGSSQPDQTAHLLLQGLGALLATVSLIPASRHHWSGAMGAFLVLVMALMLWTAIQLIPLPPETWSQLSGRQLISEGWSILGIEGLTPFSLSFAPDQTRSALLGFGPPLALFILLTAAGWRRGVEPLAWVIPALGAGSATLGLMQVFGVLNGELYVHEITNRGLPTGIFANVNHQATFCLMCLPFAAARAGRLRQDWIGDDRQVGLAILISALFLLNLTGVLAAGSVAGYMLLLPVLVLSVFLVRGTRPSGRKRGWLVYAIMGISILGSAIMVATSPILEGLGVTSFGDEGDLSRQGIWRVTGNILQEHALLGTGLGTFTEVFRLYETGDGLTTNFVNNAHNDYLQISVEWGVPGLLIVAAALLLFCRLFIRTWLRRQDQGYRLRRAASVSLLALILHSMVDYPSRTPGIAGLAMACLVILILPRHRESSRDVAPEGRPGHVTL
jgi:O-antigen ligase